MVTVRIIEKNNGSENEGLGKTNLHRVPIEGEFIKYNDSKYRVHHIIHIPDEALVEAIVS